MGCEGAPTELCGGPALLDLYNFTGTYPIGASVVQEAGGWTSRGCYRYVLALSPLSLSMSIDCLESDSVSSRTLERRVDVVGSMTVELCIPACQAESFTIAGLEYAQECCTSTNLHL